LKMPSELIVSNKTGRSNLITLPKNMDPGLAYIIGAMLGDGHIGNRSSKHGSEVVYSEMYYKSIVKLFSDKVFNIFNIKPSSIDLSNKGLIYYSTALAEILNKLGIPKGNKSRKIRVPRYIFTSNTKIIKAFISGVINSDGSGHKNMLRISSVSKLFIDDLRWLLLRLGVVSSIYISNGKTHYIKNRKIKSSKAYHLIISGRANIRKLLSSSFIDENKRKSFESNSSYIKKKGTRSKDILPVKGALRTAYYEHRQKRGKTLNEFRTAYHAGYLSKQYLKKNLVNLKSDIAKELLEIINLPLRWVKIKEIEKIKSKCFVYDLTVENDHNFICNLLVNHNTIENDVINGKIKLEEVSVITFDECHRATGDYSYVWLAKQYEKTSRFPRVLGLTASPGSDLEKINEILDNLFIEEIEVKVEDDPDVKPYVQDVEVKWEKVDFPDELKEIQKYLKSCLRSKLVEIKNFGYLNEAQVMSESKMELLKLQAHLQGELISGNRDFIAMKCVSLAAEAMKVQHAIELVETQGLVPLQAYLEDLEKKSRTTKTKAVQNLVRDINFRSALVKTKILRNSGYEHPKMGVLSRLVEDRVKGDYKLIVFTQYRDSGVKIVDELNKIENIEARLFVGQAKKKDSGLTQKKQIEMLDDFREGKFNVLVSSSVGEEGLDIPQVDEVMFYEPIPSAIRHIQRKGRTGRQEKGVVTILMTKGTRDEGYRWSAHHKEKRMYRILKDVKKNISLKEKKDTDLNKFLNEEDKVKVFADYREKGSGVIKELIELGAKMNLEALESADYVLSNRVGVEFKTQGDFVDSILDGRLLSQVKELRSNFEKPLVVVEGDRDIYSIRNVHPNAIKGVLSAVSVDFGVPILHTKNFKDTAALLHMIAKREQETERKDFSLHGLKKPMSFKELQEYIVSALPGVGGGLAKPLLREFKTVKNIVNASEEELKKVNLIGEKKAKKIKEIVDKEYSNL